MLRRGDVGRLMRQIPLHADWRVRELLNALNDQVLPKETVISKITKIAGFPIRFYQYRDGSYYICE